MSGTYATGVRQQEPQQARSFVGGHTRNEGRQPQSTRYADPAPMTQYNPEPLLQLVT